MHSCLQVGLGPAVLFTSNQSSASQEGTTKRKLPAPLKIACLQYVASATAAVGTNMCMPCGSCLKLCLSTPCSLQLQLVPQWSPVFLPQRRQAVIPGGIPGAAAIAMHRGSPLQLRTAQHPPSSHAPTIQLAICYILTRNCQPALEIHSIHHDEACMHTCRWRCTPQRTVCSPTASARMSHTRWATRTRHRWVATWISSS